LRQICASLPRMIHMKHTYLRHQSPETQWNENASKLFKSSYKRLHIFYDRPCIALTACGKKQCLVGNLMKRDGEMWKEDRRFIVLKSAELREAKLGRTAEGMLTLSLMVIITEPWGWGYYCFTAVIKKVGVWEEGGKETWGMNCGPCKLWSSYWRMSTTLDSTSPSFIYVKYARWVIGVDGRITLRWILWK
jgi:hypothetical protein